ncbi:MAG: HDOD domain-containing protein [Oceanococcaceae bacterium]
MHIAALLQSTEHLSPAFALQFRALAEDADRSRLLPILQRALGENPLGTLAALRRPPLLLRILPSREEARRVQLALGALGCVTTIDSCWRSDDWTLPEALPDRIVETVGHARSQGRSVVYALLRSSEALSVYRLRQAVADFTGVLCVLGERDILVCSPVSEEAGAAAWLRRTAQDLQSALPDAGRWRSVFVVAPEDGENAGELLDALRRHVDEAPASKAAPTFAADQPMLEWPLAGEALGQIWALGRSPRGLPEEIQTQLEPTWPSLAHAEPALSPPNHSPVQLWEAFGRQHSQRLKKRTEILQKVASMERLPTLPAAAMEAYRLACAPDTNAQILGEFVGRDPSLSTRILTVVNSPHMGLHAKVDSIRHALVLLGWEEIARLALLLSNEAVFRSLNSRQAQDLWKHSAATADVARELATRVPTVHGAGLYTAALLHDVGKVVLYAVAAPEMQELAQRSVELNLPAFQLEREQLGLDHAELGGMLLRRWGLPEELSLVVERHHGLWPGDTELRLEAALVGLADHLTHRLQGTEPGGEACRLQQAQLQLLEPYFGRQSLESLDLLAEDVSRSLRLSPA